MFFYHIYTCVGDVIDFTDQHNSQCDLSFWTNTWFNRMIHYTIERLLLVGNVYYSGTIYLPRLWINLENDLKLLEKLVCFIRSNRVDLIMPSHNVSNINRSMPITILEAIKMSLMAK